jgi:hypothetical protein
MSNTVERFDCRVIKMGESDRLPFDPFVQIVLERWVIQDSKSIPIISANLMTEAEIDEHIQQLKMNLDVVAKRAKAALIRARDETMTLVKARS